ncbi:MAG: hypothetical protein LQ346_007501 [Caloplaca aetnensis]|nr:MAG: hypothetical protein LQ346_007501 [Caloplaca aetnensis]
MASLGMMVSTSHQRQDQAGLKCLPHEILTIICGCLPLPALKNVRLASRTFAAVGAFYLLPTINLWNESSSFERLRQITQTTALRPGVHGLQFDITNVASFEPVEDWTPFWVTVDGNADPSSDLQASRLLQLQDDILSGEGTGGGPSIVKLRKAMSAIRKYTGQVPPEYFIRICKAYQAVSIDQQRMCRREGQEKAVAAMVEAFQRMPNLKTVNLAVKAEYTAGFEYADPSKNPMMSTFANHVTKTSKDLDPPGVLEFVSICRASAEAGTSLEHLRGYRLDWRIFQLPDADFSDMEKAMSRLESLDLSIIVNRLGGMLGGDPGLGEGDEALEDAMLCGVFNFLSLAPCLKVLRIEWLDMELNLDLRKAVGSYTWSSLEIIDLCQVECRDHDLRAFLKRHAGTLAILGLSDFRNLDGLWAPTFLFMRLELNLKVFQVGHLRGTDEEDEWLEDHHVSLAAGEDDITDIVSDYVIGTGPAPLLHPNQKRHGEYLVDDGNGGLTVLKV